MNQLSTVPPHHAQPQILDKGEKCFSSQKLAFHKNNSYFKEGIK
jgi:hypothetical protein